MQERECLFDQARRRMGTPASGHGREGGLAAALDYTTVKTVWLRVSDDPIPDPFVMR